MKISNERKLNLDKSLDFTSKKQVGIVLKTSEELGENKLGLYIPKLMLGIEFKKEPIEESININYDKIVNAENNQIGETSVKSRNYISLMGANIPNMTPPAFAKYEKVLVDTIDSDIKTMYYETQTFANPGKRKSDKFRMGAISANTSQKDQDVESSKNNFYHMEFDTDNQRIVIQNSIVNGEKFQFTILLDAKNGTLNMSDGKRMVSINSNDDRITLQNEADTIITMVEDTVNIQTKKLNINAEEEINIKTKNYKLETTNFEEKSDSAKTQHKTFEQNSTQGTYNIDVEKHSGTTMSINEKVGTEIMAPLTAANGVLAAASATYGGSPSLSAAIPQPPPNTSKVPVGKMEVDNGSMRVNNGDISVGAGLPVAKYNELMSLLTILAIEIDKACAAGPAVVPGISSATLAAMRASIATTKLRGE